MKTIANSEGLLLIVHVYQSEMRLEDEQYAPNKCPSVTLESIHNATVRRNNHWKY